MMKIKEGTDVVKKSNGFIGRVTWVDEFGFAISQDGRSYLAAYKGRLRSGWRIIPIIEDTNNFDNL